MPLAREPEVLGDEREAGALCDLGARELEEVRQRLRDVEATGEALLHARLEAVQRRRVADRDELRRRLRQPGREIADLVDGEVLERGVALGLGRHAVDVQLVVHVAVDVEAFLAGSRRSPRARARAGSARGGGTARRGVGDDRALVADDGIVEPGRLEVRLHAAEHAAGDDDDVDAGVPRRRGSRRASAGAALRPSQISVRSRSHASDVDRRAETPSGRFRSAAGLDDVGGHVGDLLVAQLALERRHAAAAGPDLLVGGCEVDGSSRRGSGRRLPEVPASLKVWQLPQPPDAKTSLPAAASPSPPPPPPPPPPPLSVGRVPVYGLGVPATTPPRRRSPRQRRAQGRRQGARSSGPSREKHTHVGGHITREPDEEHVGRRVVHDERDGDRRSQRERDGRVAERARAAQGSHDEEGEDREHQDDRERDVPVPRRALREGELDPLGEILASPTGPSSNALVTWLEPPVAASTARTRPPARAEATPMRPRSHAGRARRAAPQGRRSRPASTIAPPPSAPKRFPATSKRGARCRRTRTERRTDGRAARRRASAGTRSIVRAGSRCRRSAGSASARRAKGRRIGPSTPEHERGTRRGRRPAGCPDGERVAQERGRGAGRTAAPRREHRRARPELGDARRARARGSSGAPPRVRGPRPRPRTRPGRGRALQTRIVAGRRTPRSRRCGRRARAAWIPCP